MADQHPTRNTMVCLDCGYALDGLPSNVCPECGGEFDPEDATTFRRILPDPVRVGRWSITEVHAACMMLERNGIPAAIHKEEEGIIGSTHVLKGAIWVDRDDAAQARELLRTLAHAPLHAGEAWACPQCNEQIEAQFDLCWSCGTGRPEA